VGSAMLAESLLTDDKITFSPEGRVVRQSGANGHVQQELLPTFPFPTLRLGKKIRSPFTHAAEGDFHAGEVPF